MSSYNTKWLGFYILYMVITVASYIEGDLLQAEDLFYLLVLWPIIIYLMWPLFLKKFGNLKIIEWLNKIVNDWYYLIKERF